MYRHLRESNRLSKGSKTTRLSAIHCAEHRLEQDSRQLHSMKYKHALVN